MYCEIGHKEEVEMKTNWEKPELIVLVKGKPEESVLLECKMAGGYGGPGSVNDDCFSIPGPPCEAIAMS